MNLVEIRVTVFELLRYIGALRTDGQTDGRTDRQTDTADDNTPPAILAEG